MSDKFFHKFFDPKTLPEVELKAVALDYFLRVRTKLKLDFYLPEDPHMLYSWNDENSLEILKSYELRGGKEVFVDANLYAVKIKEMAKS